MSEALCNLLRDNGVSTYGAFAFILSLHPGAGGRSSLNGCNRSFNTSSFDSPRKNSD